MFKDRLMFILIFLLFILSIGIVCASDNVTDDIQSCNDSSDVLNQENIDLSESEVDNVSDSSGEDTTQADDKLTVEVNSSDIESKEYNSVIEVTPEKKDLNFVKSKYTFVKIKTKNTSTYFKSDIFFKATILDKITNSPMKGVKVLFKVYSADHKCTKYYATTNKKGVASLNKNLKVGRYTVYTYVNEKNAIYDETKSIFKVKPTAEVGCSSFYLQVSNAEGVVGFRRDSTYAADMYIKPSKWYSRTAMRQYKYNGGYFFHTITTSDGWMIGTGGADNAYINNQIEKLAGRMVASGKIIWSSLYTIQNYIGSLGIGHFAIKAPNGNYAAVWIGSIKTGKLKAGEYICVPNSAYSFRQGKYTSFDSNPEKAGFKIGASDPYGINRRDITVYHWKAVTKNFKTSSYVVVNAANEIGQLIGSSTGYLMDNIHYMGKFFSKYSLKSAPKMTFLGKYKFGNIDKLIKTQTTVKAPKIKSMFTKQKFFKITVKNKKNNNPIKNIKIKVKMTYKKSSKTYTFRTDKSGVAKFSTKKFRLGTYKLKITTGDNRYIISKNSKIVIYRVKTTVQAPSVKAKFNQAKNFKIIVKNKKNGKAIKNIKIKVKLTFNNTAKVYYFRTDKSGVVKFSTQKFRLGTHKISIGSGDRGYVISKNSKIVINEVETTVQAPSVEAKFNQTKNFKIVVKDKQGKAVKNVKVKVKITFNNTAKVYYFKTDKSGVVKFSIQKFRPGTHKITIYSGDNRYIISKNSKIIIRE